MLIAPSKKILGIITKTKMLKIVITLLSEGLFVLLFSQLYNGEKSIEKITAQKIGIKKSISSVENKMVIIPSVIKYALLLFICVFTPKTLK